MNSKDLLSINEAFANATSKVTADQPAKKDEVVAESTETEEAVQDKQRAKCDHPGCKDGKHTDGSDCKKCNGDGWISANDKLEKEASETNNIMDDYEKRLSKNFGVKNVKEKADSKGFKKPDEKVSEVDSKTQRPKGEVNADEKSKDVGGATEDLQEPVEGNPKEEEKKPKKKKKLAKESINNSNKGNIMSEDKSIFDKLYESVMGEDDEFELGIPGDDDPTAGDEFGDEGGEEVTVTLTPDQAAALKAVVDQLPSDDEEELGDVGDDDPLADTGEFEDSVQEDNQQTGEGKKPGQDPSDGGGKSTDPAAGDEFGDEGGEEVTVTLTPDQAAALKAVVDQLPSDEEDPGDDIPADDPLADTDELEDSVQEDTTQTSDGKKPGTDPSDGGGKATDPAADSLGGKTSGDGAVPVTDKEGTEQTGDGKKPGVAKNSGKPGKQAV